MVELVYIRVYKSPCFKSAEKHVMHHLDTTLWVVFNLWIWPDWGTLKNNKRTLKNRPKYAKNLEMTYNFLPKDAGNTFFVFLLSFFNGA